MCVYLLHVPLFEILLLGIRISVGFGQCATDCTASISYTIHSIPIWNDCSVQRLIAISIHLNLDCKTINDIIIFGQKLFFLEIFYYYCLILLFSVSDYFRSSNNGFHSHTLAIIFCTWFLGRRGWVTESTLPSMPSGGLNSVAIGV